MATTAHSVMLYAVILALFSFALAFIVIWSRRELRMRLIAFGLCISMAPVAYFAFSQLPGKPDGMSTEAFRENYRCATILAYPEIQQKVGIYMLVRKKKNKEPEYLFVEWNVKLAASLQKSIRMAKMNGKGSIIYAAASCEDEDDGEEGDANGKGKKGKKGKGKGKNKGNSRGMHPGSSGQEQDGDGFEFYPDPVPSMPEKPAPSYDAPLVMPER